MIHQTPSFTALCRTQETSLPEGSKQSIHAHIISALTSLTCPCLFPHSPPLSSIPAPSSLLFVLIFPFSSQQVAHTGVAVTGDMDRSLTREQQWRGAWSAPAAAALHPTHPQLILSLLVEGRGVGVNTATSLRSSPVAMQVEVVGEEGEQTRGGEGQARGRRAGGEGGSRAAARPHQRLRLQVGSGSCGVVGGVTCTVVSAFALLSRALLTCKGRSLLPVMYSLSLSLLCLAGPSLQAFRPLGINAPPPPTPPRLLEPCLSFCFMYFFSIPSALKSHHSLGRNSQATDLPLAIPGKPLRFSGLSPSHLPCMLCSCTCTLRPLATYSPALRVCLAGGGEGCGVSTAIPSRLSPAAVQRGTHTGRLGGGLPGKESPAAAAAALCKCAGTPSGASVQVPPQVQPLGLQFVTWPPPVAPPLSRLANAVPSLALSPFIPSLPTDQLCVCALQVEGRGGGQHGRFPTPLPGGRAGSRGDGREAALPIAAPRESIGVGLASQGHLAFNRRHALEENGRGARMTQQLSQRLFLFQWRGGAGVNTDASPRSSPMAVQVPVGMGGRQHGQSLPQGRVSGLKEGGSTGAWRNRGIPSLNSPPLLSLLLPLTSSLGIMAF
ncbi:unnamed protein product [Closterium sp. NIES-65]|nr:unnamed protein product [Closterium sp. NIES-65]